MTLPALPVSARQLHRFVSYAGAAVLIFMSLTGVVWAVAYRLLHCEKASVKWLLQWHQGDITGETEYLRAPFCVIAGAMALTMLLTGATMLNWKSLLNNRSQVRRLHQKFAMTAAVPLLTTTVTGVAWAVAR
jgi:hypothetical protein